MSANGRGHRCTDLFDQRLARLRKLIALNAPRIIIVQECELVMRAHYGGRAKILWHVGLDSLRHCWVWYAQIPAMRALCRANIYHMEQGPNGDGFGCPFCGRGASPEIINTIEEVADALDL